MKLSELIVRLGDDNIVIQNLDQCVSDYDMTKKGTKARFVTEEPFDLKGFKKLGFIVWMDRERVADIIAISEIPPQ